MYGHSRSRRLLVGGRQCVTSVPWRFIAEVTPNPSLERTHTGKALGPRGVVVHHPPRGPGASPVRSAQLKR